MPRKYKLALAVEGVDLHDEDQIEDLMERLPDVHWRKVAGQVQAVALLDCAKQDIAAAVRRIIDAVTASSPNAEVIDVVEDFVSISDIAKRSGFTRQYARMLVTGERGPGGFPRSLGSVGKTRIWDWAPVSTWLQANYDLGDSCRLLTRDELASLRRAIVTQHPDRRHQVPHEGTHHVGV